MNKIYGFLNIEQKCNLIIDFLLKFWKQFFI